MWQPMKTAPTDTMVWVWHRRGGYSLGWLDPARGRWELKGDERYSGPDNLDLTAWHPLPEPPPAELR